VIENQKLVNGKKQDKKDCKKYRRI